MNAHNLDGTYSRSHQGPHLQKQRFAQAESPPSARTSLVPQVQAPVRRTNR